MLRISRREAAAGLEPVVLLLLQPGALPGTVACMYSFVQLNLVSYGDTAPKLGLVEQSFFIFPLEEAW